MELMVDGDNVLRALGIVPARGVSFSKEAVEQFLNRLETVAARRAWEVVVVFDGPERFMPRETGHLVIHYSGKEDADHLIERMVYQRADRSSCVVVTQDQAQARLVLGLGARVWTPRRLIEELGYTEPI